MGVCLNKMATVDETRSELHAELSQRATEVGATSSQLVGSVSRHVLPETVSFADLAKLHSHVKHSATRVPQFDFVTTSGDELVFSTRFDFVPTAPVTPPARTAKRKRDGVEERCDAIDAASRRLRRIHPEIPVSEYEVAETVLKSSISTLRGPHGEVLVQSCCVLAKKLRATDTRSSLVVAMRLNAGIPVPVTTLKRAMASCWHDGVVSSLATVMGVVETDLPLSDEGQASLDEGNRSMLVVTSVLKDVENTPPDSTAAG